MTELQSRDREGRKTCKLIALFLLSIGSGIVLIIIITGNIIYSHGNDLIWNTHFLPFWRFSFIHWNCSPDSSPDSSAGGEKKAITQKLEWKASSRIGSLENAKHKPGNILLLIRDDFFSEKGRCSTSYTSDLLIRLHRLLDHRHPQVFKEGRKEREKWPLLSFTLDSLPALVSLETQEWESRAGDAKILKLMMLLFKDPHEVRGEDKKMPSSSSSSSKESASSPSTRGVTSSSSLYINCSCCVVCDSRLCYWLKLSLGREWVPSLWVSHFHFLPFSTSSLHSSEAVFVLFFSFMFFLV